jgi:carotenoid cleavage dioxygenase
MERAQRGGPAFAWEPEKGAYVGVMKRNASVDTIRWIEVDPVYVFHPMNAWEDGDLIHIELMEYKTAPLFPNADGSKGDTSESPLVRWTIDLADPRARVTRTQLDDLAGEFPRFDERLAGLPYRHGWYAASSEGLGDDDILRFDSIAHVDLRTGKRALHRFGKDDTVGEPIFVPRSADAPEGDGHVLTIVHRAADNRSDLVILNAQDMAGAPEAILEVPRRVPAGFHGNWVGA